MLGCSKDAMRSKEEEQHSICSERSGNSITLTSHSNTLNLSNTPAISEKPLISGQTSKPQVLFWRGLQKWLNRPHSIQFNFRSRTSTLLTVGLMLWHTSNTPFESPTLMPLHSICWICSSIQSYLTPLKANFQRGHWHSIPYPSWLHPQFNPLWPLWKSLLKGHWHSILSTLSTSAIYIYLFLIRKLLEYMYTGNFP